jgi:hypothetical protein
MVVTDTFRLFHQMSTVALSTSVLKAPNASSPGSKATRQESQRLEKKKPENIMSFKSHG